MKTDTEPLSVAELTRQLKELVEANFWSVRVVGEISNLTRSRPGHVYLTLKDDAAQLKAVIWRLTAGRIRFDLHDGLEVVAAGRLEVYPPRGQYQLVVDELVPQGLGPLELAFRQLQEKLAAEGLFAPERKRPLPRFPRRIAVVTSPTGAAVRDLLQVITRRWRGADLVLLPVPVQGETAAPLIARALGAVHRIPRVDVAVLTRGGGSLEDLWAFNEECVARAVFGCKVPVVCGVGHEIDVTIADLVADRRALTPSEAGELVVPAATDVERHVERLRDRLQTALAERSARSRMRLDALAARTCFTRPYALSQRIAEKLDALEHRLVRSVQHAAETARRQADALAAAIDALSPLKVLGRGYSLTRRLDERRTVVRSATDAQPGEAIETLLARGRLVSRVEAAEERSPVGTQNPS